MCPDKKCIINKTISTNGFLEDLARANSLKRSIKMLAIIGKMKTPWV